MLTATGRDVKVSVRVPGGKVLYRGTIRENETRSFNNPRITLVSADAGALEVTINGKKQPRGAAGERRVYHITRTSAGR